MDIEKIKQRILDLAIRGKLVPQDPNDEPASVLIEKIKAEKEKMIKEGKIKSSKDDSYIYKASDNCYYEKKGNIVKNVTSEIPFDIPNNWSWARLYSIGTTNIGLTYRPENICENGTIVLRSSNIKNNKIDLNDLVRVNSVIHDNQYINNNDILICARNGSKALVGKCALYTYKDQKMSFGAFMAIFRTKCYKYTYYYFLSKQFRSNFENENNKQINQVTQDILKNSLIPIPPLQEQYKICETIEKYFDLLNNIENNINSIKELVYYIKNKILDHFFCENSSYKSYYENEFELGKIIEYEQPTDYIVKNPEYDDKYATPVLTAGKSFLLGYTNETEGVYHIKSGEKVIIFDDFTTSSHLVDFDFKVKSSAMKILRSTDNELFNIEYLYYFLKTLKIDTDNHKRYWISKYAPMKVKVHTYEEQCKIIQTIKKIQYTLLNIE